MSIPTDTLVNAFYATAPISLEILPLLYMCIDRCFLSHRPSGVEKEMESMVAIPTDTLVDAFYATAPISLEILPLLYMCIDRCFLSHRPGC